MNANGFVRARGSTERPPNGEALWFVFAQRHLLLQSHPDGAHDTLPRSTSLAGLDLASWLQAGLAENAPQAGLKPLYIGTLDGTPCMALLLDTEEIPPGYTGRDLRALYGRVSDTVWSAAGLAYQLLFWADSTRFCPRSGDRTYPRDGEWAMECPACGLLQYPRISPCIIVLVHADDRVLLTRQPGWPQGRYGLVAGFVEPGETLEQCLAREVREETGVQVDDIRYFDSQPWPFPHQLMVGFTARHAGGEVVVDPYELEDAAWFSIDNLPILPPPLSIARRIIDAYVAAHRHPE